MSSHRIEFDEQCRSCGGTGLYLGMAEHSGAAVVCSNCKGTGCRHTVVEYDDFEERRERPNVRRVLQANPGIGVGESEDRGIHLEDFGGMPYEEWRQGKPFPPGSEMRRFTCPAWWYQTANYDLKPGWRECDAAFSFARCPLFPLKEKCWARFDAEHPELAVKSDGAA